MVTVKLPPATWRTRDDLVQLVEVLGGTHETRLVGGSVRDGLLGQPVSDIDMATRLTPDVVIERLGSAGIRVIPTGIGHGTVTAVTKGGPVEVTTLRRDVSTDGRHATVAFSEDWREDAARRDFTINALYADLAGGEIFDWFDGVADLQARRVRFIGNPLTRIAEDHLRILRFFRFHARFGTGAPDAEGVAACIARANDLMALSRERIASELLKILDVDDPEPVVRLMIETGVLRPVLPELVDVEPLKILVAREAQFGVAGDPIRRLSAVIGPSSALAASIGQRLKLSNAKQRRLVLAADRATDRPDALAYRLGLDSAVDRLLLGNGTAAEINSLNSWERAVLPIGGGALIARGLTPGPVVARTLNMIESNWIDAGFPTGPAFERIVTDAISAAI